MAIPQRKHDRSAEFASTLRTWASLCAPAQSSWTPVAHMIHTAEAEALKLESGLLALISASDASFRSISLRDPLMVDAGLNRWLREDREEAYSDWLAWVFEQLTAVDVLRVLGIDNPELVVHARSKKFTVQREYFIPAGRLDLLLSLDQSVLIVIEVKKSAAENAETAKQAGYFKWLDSQPQRYRKPLLLITDASEEEYQQFSTIRWSDLCLRLRGLLLRLETNLDLVKKAMIIAFVSAVETNLLNLVVPPADEVQRLFYAKTVEYLKRSVGGTSV